MMDSIVLQQSSSSTAYGGGRAIDRHNPIIRDEKRLTQTNPHHHQRKSKETTNKDLKQEADAGDQKKKSVAFADGDDDEFIKPRDFISPATSARCLLSDKDTFNSSSEFDHVPPPPPPCEPLISHNGKAFKKKDEPLKIDFNEAFKKKDDDLLSAPPPLSPPPPSCEGLRFLNSDDNSLSSSPPNPPPLPPPDQPLEFHNYKASNKKQEDSLSSATAKPPSPPPPSSNQVVVLDVSLHCRGCERKMRKHISKIEGVTSFKIEFAAKKVTVVGDVTPLAVLTSVLKVKNAKLLIPATISSSSLTDSKH